MPTSSRQDGLDTEHLNQSSGVGWTYQEALSPTPSLDAEDDIFLKSGITPEMILQSQRNDVSMQHIYSTVFTKENIQKLGFRNLIKQIRSKLGKTTQVPTCEIRVKNVDYTAPNSISDSQIETLASAFRLPSWVGSQKQDTKYILKNVNAIFKPGTMTLVLGPPGCGKTTLLKHLAGILHVKGNEQVSGSVTYNGCKPSQIDLSSLAAYVQQSDNHYPTLTVKETFEFSHKCLVGTVDPNDPLAVNEQHMVDILISVFGLSECADTIIGDDMIRGVSGGQKRRVTVGEMMTGRATTLLLDEFSNGLDASTTYDIAKAVRTMAEVLEKTVVMTMLQPPPEVYDLFDNILVLDKGEVVYNGPRTTLPSYFRSIGYECPPRKDVADFLQEVTTHLGPRYATSCDRLIKNKRPATSSEFAARFRESSVFQNLMAEVSQTDKHSWNFATATMSSKVALGYTDCLKVVFGRTLKASLRDGRFNRSRMIQALVLGTVVGTVFLDIGRNEIVENEKNFVPIKVGLLYLATMFQALATLSAIESIIARRSVLYKQSAFHFFHVSTYAISEAILELLWTIPQVLLFSTPLYFAVGLANSASGFVTFAGLLYLSSTIYSQLFKLITAVSPNAVLAKVYAMLVLFLHIVFSGYILPESKIPTGWIWLYWSNPMSWILRGLCQNEFLSPTPVYEVKVPAQLGNGTQGKFRLGDISLDLFGMSTNPDFTPGAVGVLVGIYLVLLGLTTLAYTHVRIRSRFSTTSADAKATDAVPPDAVAVVFKSSRGGGVNSLPFEPVTLSFRDLYYTIELGKGKDKTTRQLLKGIHGCFQPGSLTALMGSTGAGKTTLMDVIAGRKTAGVIEGDMFVNGHALERHSFNSVSGYCEQNDLHEETATIREAFHFSAALRLPSNTTQDQRQSFVDDILDVLELTPRANAQYLTLSQGERKRVTIGVELLSNPSILFLDEPTTGLDSRAATIVMECIKRIAESGRTVVCTIHQPSTVLFELFDKLLLLKSGGELVYFGDLGSKSIHLLEYFANFGGLEPMASTENPATYMLNCIGAGTGDAKIDVDFAASYIQSNLGQANDALVSRYAEPTTGSKLSSNHMSRLSFGAQFSLLFGRQWTTYWRSPSYNISRAVLMVFMPLIYVSCFYDMEVKTNMDVLNQMALVFMAVSMICIATMSTAIPFVARSRNVFYREKLSAMYSPAAHSLSLAAVELIYTIVLSSMFFHGFYWLCGLNTDTEAWGVFWVGLASSLVLWSYFGHFLVYSLPTMQIAVLLAGGLASLLFVFSGFMIDGENLAKGWQWLYWISPLHYTLETVIMSQFKSQFGLVADLVVGKHVPINQYVEGYFHGAFSYDNINRSLGLLWVINAVLQVLILLCMAKVNHMKR